MDVTQTKWSRPVFGSWRKSTIEDDKPTMRKHDMEEFTVIIERYGLWDPIRRQMGKAMKPWLQQELPDFDVEIEHNGKVATLKGEQLEQLNA